MISGGDNNFVSGVGSFVGGGGYDGSLAIGNNNAGNAAVIVGGMANAIASGGNYSVIPGGYGNSIGASAQLLSPPAIPRRRIIPALSSGRIIPAPVVISARRGQTSSSFARKAAWVSGRPIQPRCALTIRYPLGVPPNPCRAGRGQRHRHRLNTASSGYKWIQTYGGSLTLNPLGNYVGVNTTNPTHPFQVGNAYCDGSAWYPASDRNLKSGFAPVDAAEILAKVAALPITAGITRTT